MAETLSGYWEHFYSVPANAVLQSPTQFAVFALSEAADVDAIIDVGCGNGRDSMFFASFGKAVLGVDAAKSAIDRCRAHAKSLQLANAQFQSGRIGDQGFEDDLSNAFPNWSIMLYARFFLHAIDEESQSRFLELAKRLSAGHCTVAVEFRTLRDASQAKVTPDHFRRFINPVDFLQKAQEAGLTLRYFVEGFGFAKYKTDDAHVARCIFRNRP